MEYEIFKKGKKMFETVCKIIIGIDLMAFVVLFFASLSKDLLDWVSKKDDPEWAKEYEKYLKDFLRAKRDMKWGG